MKPGQITLIAVGAAALLYFFVLRRPAGAQRSQATAAPPSPKDAAIAAGIGVGASLLSKFVGDLLEDEPSEAQTIYLDPPASSGFEYLDAMN